MKTTKKLLVLLLCMAFVFSAAACSDKPNDEVSNTTSETSTDSTDKVKADVPENRRDASAREGNNDTKPFVISTLTMDGKFNPFYATSQTDVNAMMYTQINLITNSSLAEPVAGVNEATFAYSYEMSTNDDKSESTYEIILKNGITFSDGVPVTGKDVLFNLYQYLDPKYTGSSTLYSMDIKGLQSYRTQILDESVLATKKEENLKKAKEVVAAYNEKKEISKEELATIWSAVKKFITNDSSDLIKYSYTPADLGLEQPDDYSENYTNSIILIYIGGLSYSKTDDKWTLNESAGLDVAKLKDYSTDEYIEAAFKYVKENMTAAEYDEESGYTTVTGNEPTAVDALVNDYELAYIEANKGTVKSISGITLDKTTDENGVERERVTVKLNGVDPKAIWNFTFQVAPMHYYSTKELSDAANGVDAFGVGFSSTEFQDQLKQKNVPLGAGPYIAADKALAKTDDVDKFFKDGIVNFIANDNFMLAAPNIKYLRCKTISSGSEVQSLKSGDVHYTEPSAKVSTINDLADTKYKNILVENLGYGYIGINAAIIKDVNARRAIASALNVERSLEYYTGGLAEVIYRSMSKVSWAYPKDAKAMYPFDSTAAKSKEFFLNSDNFKEVDGKIKNADGSDVKYTFVLPSDAANHPAGPIFKEAQEVLEKIGVIVDIEVRDSLLNDLETGTIEVWAAAWQATIDPDIFQVYYSDNSKNTSSSPKSFGLYDLYKNGTDEEKATLKEINELIMAARESLNVDERKPSYFSALDKLMEICVEMPTYQRKNMYAYDSEIIDSDSLWSDITPYRGPLYEIWNVSLK